MVCAGAAWCAPGAGVEPLKVIDEPKVAALKSAIVVMRNRLGVSHVTC